MRFKDLGVARLTLLGGILGVAMISCGDPVISATAYEMPLLDLEGHIQPFPVADLTSPRVTVVWVDPAGAAPDIPAEPQTIHFDLDPAGGFHLQLFAPPPSTAGVGTLVSSQNADVQFSLGEVVLFDDLDGEASPTISPSDDLIVGPDDYRGATATDVVVYIDQTNAENMGLALPILSDAPGYHLGSVDCNTFGPPSIANATGSDSVLVMQVVPPSSSLPYVRTCLQSHPLGGP